ncbi:MAG: selenocysteine-specific translation elongation factor, partial [Candidatus Eisenbacteria bacterium]|nr:selenocysteine-specific translation elongation factor [Candidatus Eisenbacteria bacterium]
MSQFAILGTAGHIDHGKTSLVKLLTGADTDRLKEEKARGISIELGFTHLELGDDLSLGIVDVPGHERFIKNMLAGACGMDAVMLVIAADEGVMPQTREHLDILHLLGVKRGLVALTKTDMVEEEWLELITESVQEYLEERGYGHFPLVPVSSKTGEGKDNLLNALREVMQDLPTRSVAKNARLPIDRSFVVEGFGTVVTGTLWQGEIRVGDQLLIEPGASEARVRNVEVHGEQAEVASTGQRTAVALARTDKNEVPRGSWLVTPNAFESASMIDVRLRVLADAGKALAQRQRVRFHLGASEALGRVTLFQTDSLEPGSDGLAQIRLESPVLCARHDRFVIRSYSPARTIAGGTIIVPKAPKRKPHDASVVVQLEREESGTPEERVLAYLSESPKEIAAKKIMTELNLNPSEFDGVMQSLQESGSAVALGDGWLSMSQGEQLSQEALNLMLENQKQFPLRWGMSRGELKSRLMKGMSPTLFDWVVGRLLESGEISERADHFRAGASEHELSPHLQAQVEQVRKALTEGGNTPPTVKELTNSLGFSVLEPLEYLTFLGEAVKVTPDLFWAQS